MKQLIQYSLVFVVVFLKSDIYLNMNVVCYDLKIRLIYD